MIASGRLALRWLSAILLVVGFLWMDICLYLKIQSYEDKGKVDERLDDDLYEQQTFNTSLLGPLGPLAERFSFAFGGISVKLMMSDPVDNYIMGPLAEQFARLCDFKQRFLFISANMVSYTGVASALIAASLLPRASSAAHKLSFLFFQIRTFLDDLDGIVARARKGIYKHVSLTNTPGYVVDGVCDAIGFAAYIIGCYLYLKTGAEKSQSREALEQTTARANAGLITGFKSPSSSRRSASYSPLGQEEEMDASMCDSESDCEILMETNDEAFEIFCHDSSREVSPSYGRVSQRFRGLLQSNGNWSPAAGVSRQSDQSHKGRTSNLSLFRHIGLQIRQKLSNRKLVLLFLAFSLQLLLSSFFWNRYILLYRDLLESPSGNALQARTKRKALKSNVMFFLFWFWRLTNGHSLMQLFAGSILMGKVLRFLEIIKYTGFVEIVLLAILTELHVHDLRSHLDELH